MLPKKNRLQKDWVIKKTRQRGRRFQTRFIRLVIAKRKGGDTSRFAIVTSVKTSKQATKRNLLKRRVREAIKRILSDIKSGYDIVISMSPSSLNLSVIKIQEELVRSLNKGRYLKK